MAYENTDKPYAITELTTESTAVPVREQEVSYTTVTYMYMHEYGHSFDSKRFGPMYLFGIGLPSLASAYKSKKPIREWNGKPVSNPYNLYPHDIYWTELRANSKAKEYFEKYYDIDWEKDIYPQGYPTYNSVQP